MRGNDGIREGGGGALNSTTACMIGRTNEALRSSRLFVKT